jgi:ribosomal protein S18 acetylase RimI-like enzyme
VSLQVRPATKSDIRPLSAALARSFHDDPVATWLLPDDASRVARQARLFAAMTRHQHLADGGVEVACDGPTIGAAALWDPPGRWQESRRAVAMMLPTLIPAMGRRLSALKLLGDLMKAEHPEEPHWYLAVIGADTAARGRGLGAALMRSRLQRCDAEHAPAYLESSKADNVPFYQRFGFEVTGELVVPGGPTLWKMWREPR